MKVEEITLWIVDWTILYRTSVRQWQNYFSDILYCEDGQFKIVWLYDCVKPVQDKYGDFFLHQKLAEFLGKFQLQSLLWFLLKFFADCSQKRKPIWCLQSGKKSTSLGWDRYTNWNKGVFNLFLYFKYLNYFNLCEDKELRELFTYRTGPCLLSYWR